MIGKSFIYIILFFGVTACHPKIQGYLVNSTGKQVGISIQPSLVVFNDSRDSLTTLLLSKNIKTDTFQFAIIMQAADTLLFNAPSSKQGNVNNSTLFMVDSITFYNGQQCLLLDRKNIRKRIAKVKQRSGNVVHVGIIITDDLFIKAKPCQKNELLQ